MWFHRYGWTWFKGHKYIVKSFHENVFSIDSQLCGNTPPWKQRHTGCFSVVPYLPSDSKRKNSVAQVGLGQRQSTSTVTSDPVILIQIEHNWWLFEFFRQFLMTNHHFFYYLRKYLLGTFAEVSLDQLC